jgi:SAM-dependent methyltransferase
VPDLAREAARNLDGFGDVQVVNADFECWRPVPERRFDLVLAATSWHWLDPDIRYQHAWELLRPGGHLAFWSATHVFPPEGDPFFREIQDVYDEIGQGGPEPEVTPAPGELPEQHDEIERSGMFRVVDVRQYDWEIRYHAESYIDLLLTFSGHIAMADWQRERLFSAIRTALAARREPVLRRHWGAALHVARRL